MNSGLCRQPLHPLHPIAAVPRQVRAQYTQHSAQRRTSKQWLKANGKHPSHKEKFKIVNSNSNLNLGFMDVTTVSEEFEIHDKEN